MGTVKWTGDNLDNPAIVAVDLGNNYLKVYAFLIEDGQFKSKEFSMPHGYVQLSVTGWKEAQASEKTGRGRTKQSYVFQIATGGTPRDPEIMSVSVGHGAFTSANNRPLLGSNKYIAGGIDALLCAVLCELFPKHKYPKGHNNLIVGYGFPSTEWQQIETIEQLIKKTHYIIDPNGDKRKFRVRASVSWDENVGGLMNAMSFNNRDPDSGQFKARRFEPNDRVIVFDAGGWLGSMAWATIDDNGFAVMNYADSISSIDGGAITVRKSLRNTLKLKFDELRGVRDIDLTDDILDNALKTGRLTLSGNKERPLNIEDALSESLTYITQVKDIYTNYFAGGRLADHILMTGGTTDQLYDYLIDCFEHNSIHLAGKRDLIYLANVRGGMAIVIDRLIVDGLLPDPYREKLEQMEKENDH